MQLSSLSFVIVCSTNPNAVCVNWKNKLIVLTTAVVSGHRGKGEFLRQFHLVLCTLNEKIINFHNPHPHTSFKHFLQIQKKQKNLYPQGTSERINTSLVWAARLVMSFTAISGQKNLNFTLYHCLCWQRFRGLQFMTLSLSKLCRKTFTEQVNYKLFCTVGNRGSTVLIFFTTHLLAAKPGARCEFPLLSQCQPGLRPSLPLSSNRAAVQPGDVNRL